MALGVAKVYRDCTPELQLMPQKFCKFSAFSLEFQSFSWSLEQFFLRVGQNNFGNKIPFQLLINEKFCLINFDSNSPKTGETFWKKIRPGRLIEQDAK